LLLLFTHLSFHSFPTRRSSDLRSSSFIWYFVQRILRNSRFTSRSPTVQFCHPSKRTTRTISSISFTILLTITGVVSVLSSRNSSVSAALAVFRSSFVSDCFSACKVSLAMLHNSLINSIELISPHQP